MQTIKYNRTYYNEELNIRDAFRQPGNSVLALLIFVGENGRRYSYDNRNCSIKTQIVHPTVTPNLAETNRVFVINPHLIRVVCKSLFQMKITIQ